MYTEEDYLNYVKDRKDPKSFMFLPLPSDDHRFLEYGERIKAGDEFLFLEGWESAGERVGKLVGEDFFVEWIFRRPLNTSLEPGVSIVQEDDELWDELDREWQPYGGDDYGKLADPDTLSR